MNIDIKVRKTNIETNPRLTISFGDTSIEQTVIFLNQTIHLVDINHSQDTKLIIRRDDPDLYFTRYNHHTNKIFIDKIIIDDFWELTHDFNTPISIPDIAYNNHVAQVGDGEWIPEALKQNTTLFFNGSLEWSIMHPVRRTFFKDIHR